MSKPFAPHDYQLRAIQHLCKAEAGRGLFMEPGLGKTSVSLAAFDILRERGLEKVALVVAPRRPCYLVWPKELRKWADFGHLKHVNLHALKTKERIAAVKAGGTDIFIINYDGLAPLLAEAEKLKVWPFDVLIVDESTKLKHTNTQRFKNLKPLLHKFNRRWILTGTPAPKGLDGLFGQVYVADLGERLGKFITHFRREYYHEFRQANYSTWEIRNDSQKRIEKKLEGFALTLLEADHLKRPKASFNDIPVTLHGEGRALYDQLESEFYAGWASGEITAANAAAKATKLRQIVGGNVYGQDAATLQREVYLVNTEKLDALEDLIEELQGSPLLVAVGFLPEVAAIRKRLGYEVPYLGGGVSDKKGEELEAQWNAGEIPVLLAHPQSTSHGLNLQDGPGHTVAWYTLTWSLEDFIQFNRRVDRQGQKLPVTIHRILAENTIDQRVCEILSTHGATQSSLMNALKRK